METNAVREVSIESLIHNYHSIRRLSPTPLCAVIKADAYGHGAARLALLYEALGVSYLAVATLGEGVALRERGARCPILILGYTPPVYASYLVAYKLTQSGGSLPYLFALSREVTGTLSVHIQVDCGMGRYGFPAKEVAVLEKIKDIPHIKVTGVYTHYPTADMEEDGGALSLGIQQFSPWREAARRVFGDEVILHDANSACFLRGHGGEMARVGILLYGYLPSRRFVGALPLIPAMTLKSHVVALRTLSCGEGVGYGHTFVAKEKTLVATLSVGYADGLTRNATGHPVYIRGVPCPILGRVCMDACMVDASHTEGLSLGEPAILFGKGAKGADALADKAGTIPYEILSRVGSRVPIRYI